MQRAGQRTAIEAWAGAPAPDGLVFIGRPDMPDAAALAARLAVAG